MNKLRALITFCFGILAIISCDPGVSPTVSETAPADAHLLGSHTFTMNGDTLILIIPRCECDGEKLDTRPILDGFVVSVTESTLVIQSEVYDSINSIGATVTTLLNYTRYAHDSEGLNGWWQLAGVSYLHDKPISTADSVLVESRIPFANGAGYEWIRIDQPYIAFYAAGAPLTFSERFLLTWEKYYADNVLVNASRQNDSVLVLAGLVSEDTVTVVQDEYGNVTYTLKPGNILCPPYTYYVAPTEEQCPNLRYPQWFTSVFFADNARE